MNKFFSIKKILLIIVPCVLIFLLGCVTTFAMTPIPPDSIDEFTQNGQYDEWLQNANIIGDHKISRNMYLESNEEIESLNNASGPDQRPLTNRRWMPTEGTIKVLTLLVEFPDQLHYSNETIEAARTTMFGEENVNSSNYPYESVAAYYKRSSYNKLNISGDVLGWYKTKYNSSYYEQQGDRMVLIREVLEYYKSQGLDFEQYDNDNDGYLDGLYIRYANRTHSLGGFWWAYMYYGGSMDWYEIDGKKIYGYVWIPNNEVSTGWKGAQTTIHETGHLLGLPDLYDYDGNYSSRQGPDGGVGGFDMMDANRGDHNAFSKYLLGWIEPTIISSGYQTVDLKPYATDPHAILIMPNATGNALSEFYIAQYVTFTGNYSDLPNLYRPINLQNQGGSYVRQYPTEGIVVYHIDATPNTSNNFGFMYDNSYASHKLVKIMEADGTNKIETLPYTTYSGYKCGSEDFFASAKTFSDSTTPNSKKYDGINTNMQLIFQTPTSTYARVDIGYPSAGQIPAALTAFYNNQTNKVHIKFDSAITSYTNYSNIELKQKYSDSSIRKNCIIGENEIIITPTVALNDGRYIVDIPANSVKNSNNVGNSAAQLNIAVETYPILLKRQLRLDAFQIYARDLNNTTLTDEFLNSNSRSIYGYVEIYNNTSSSKQYSVYLIRKDSQRLAVLNVSDLTVDAYQSNYIYTNTLPVTDIEKNRLELLLWEKNSLQPITISRILE